MEASPKTIELHLNENPEVFLEVLTVCRVRTRAFKNLDELSQTKASILKQFRCETINSESKNQAQQKHLLITGNI